MPKRQLGNIPTPQEVSVPPYAGFDEDASVSPEEAQSRIALMLAQSRNLETMSETTEAEVKLVGALTTVGSMYGIGLLNNYLEHYLKLKISLHRQGRKEIQEVAKPTPGSEDKMRQSLRSMLLGGGRV